MKKVIFFSSALLVMSCTKNVSRPLTESEKREITVNVSRMLNQYFDDIHSKGLNAEFAYLDSTSEFFWVPPGYSESIGYDSVKTAIQKNASMFDTIKNTWTTLTIQALSPELASYTGIIHSVMVDTSGKKSEVNLIETGIVIKRASGWKLLNGQTTQIQ